MCRDSETSIKCNDERKQRGGSNGRLAGLQTWERMLSLDSDGVRAQLVSIMSDGETGDLETEVMVWRCGRVATK